MNGRDLLTPTTNRTMDKAPACDRKLSTYNNPQQSTFHHLRSSVKNPLSADSRGFCICNYSARGKMADSDSESWGNREGNSQNEGSQRELDRFLPIANVSRIMKKALPANAKISKDAKETVQECVSEFISFITGEASDKCQREKRKTVNGDDLLWAMSTLGFEDYVEPLKIYLQRFRDTEGEKTTLAGRENGGAVGGYEGAYGVMGGPQIQGPVYGYGPDGGSGYHVGLGSSRK